MATTCLISGSCRWSGALIAVLSSLGILQVSGVFADAEKPKVLLILERADVEPFGNGDLRFKCKLTIENNTGAELKVRSNFWSAFDGMVLVVQDTGGKELKKWPYVLTQSPMAEKREYPLLRGKTTETISFIIGELPKGQSKFRLKIVGTLPGSGYEPSLSSNVREVTLKVK